MEQEIYQILRKHKLTLKKREEVLTDLLLLFNVSKRHLIDDLLSEMDVVHSEYHREIVKDYLDDGC